MAFPLYKILSAKRLAQLIKESNGNGERFCFILGSGASVLTSMGSVRALISAHTALMLFASSTVEKDTSWSKS